MVDKNTMMNGASRRLRKFRQALEAARTTLNKAAVRLLITQKAIEDIKDTEVALQEVVHDLRQAETLALPENWRILARFDEPFAIYYFTNVELGVLKMGLQSCPVDRLELLLEFISGELARKGKPKI